MDVTSLYTNIPHDEGIQAISELLNSKWKYSLPGNENLIRLSEMVFKYNKFSLNDEQFLYINDTAIGTRIVPTYANLFMDHIERNFICPHLKCPQIWFRFIDDIWGINRGSEQDL